MALDYDEIARKHGFSPAAVEEITRALIQGNNTQAQFNHPELGGMGQWQPGMIMIGDMFNNSLKARVEALCVELAGLVKNDESLKIPSIQQWWPEKFGQPTMLGEQNQIRYAYFQNLHRLLIMRHNTLHVYDTGTLHIRGVSQQQSESISTLLFRTDSGTVTVQDLEEIID